MFDTMVLVTFFIALAGALVAGYLNGQRKDRCLRDFTGDHVSLERVDGHIAWGKMVLESSGLELIYRSDVQDADHIETSYVLYKDEFPQIQAIYRYCDELDHENWERRERELDRTFHPGFWRCLRRRSRNFVNLASESLSQAITVIIGQVRKPAGKYITDAGEEYLDHLGQNVIGYVGTKYDPLLERFVGTKVVVEVTEDGVVYKHVGILKDYTADFLEILDVHYPARQAVQVSGQNGTLEDRNFRLLRKGNELRVINTSENPLLLQRLRVGDEIKPLNAVLDKTDELSLFLPDDIPNANVELGVKVIRDLDWILPRRHALIRHKAERYDTSQFFDIGYVLRLDRYVDAETQYLDTVQEDPDDALSALELGQLLYRRGKLSEAEQWFRYVLERKEHLPDGGKLARRQLRLIKQERLRRKQAVPRTLSPSGDGADTLRL